MKIYLASLQSQSCYINEEEMKIYLAGDNGRKHLIKENKLFHIYMLESFYYIKDWQIDLIKRKVLKGFMLDSGAFTFMQNKDKAVDWDEYTENYANFIKKYNIELFIEMDIDSIVGLKEVERLRTKLEDITNKKCIPVWHKSRGKEYFLQMVKDYDYIALGWGNNIRLRKKHEKYINWFIKQAHKNNCKIHGLGFTPSNLKEYRFDSVDSKSWITGNLGKFIFKFNNGKMRKINLISDKKFSPKKVAQHNFSEWIKFQKYAEKYL